MENPQYVPNTKIPKKEGYKFRVPGSDKFKLNRLEQLILKPVTKDNSIYDLTKEEIEIYLRINTNVLEKIFDEDIEVNEKLVVICKTVQDFIKEHYEELQQNLNSKEEKADEER